VAESELRGVSQCPPPRLRILIASRGVLPIGAGAGGAELVALQLSKALAVRGHQVTLIADIDRSRVTIPPCLEVVPVGMEALRGLVMRLPRGFPRWLLQHLTGNLAVGRRIHCLVRRSPAGFHVIHCHGALAAVLTKRTSAVPVVYTEHDATPWTCHYRRRSERFIRKAVYRTLNVVAFRQADRVVTNFPLLAQELTDRWGIPQERVASIQNAIDIDELTDTRAGLLTVSEELGVGHYCLFVGSLEPRKAPDVLLRALSEAPGIVCVLVGDGPDKRRLGQLAQQLGVAERLRFAGHLAPTELGRYYAGADLLVLPSFSEASPLVVLESMACGTPVVASRVGGIPGVVEDWKTGFLVKPGDVGQLTMVLRFLTEDRARLQRMGDEAQKRIQHCLWPTVLEHYISLYEAVSGLRSAAPERRPGCADDTNVDLVGSAQERGAVPLEQLA
jgi:glycosyltransferase involved in cell wall biosynthesis